MPDLPPTIPLFPLPNVVLFPHVLLPLHIFEPRYRELLQFVLAGNPLIGMVLLKPGFQTAYERHPAVFDVGCAGVITRCDTLANGRSNIILQGVERFRVTDEDRSRSFRVGTIEPLPDLPAGPECLDMRRLRLRLDALLAARAEREHGNPRLPKTHADDAYINALSQYLDLEPVERQALLECDSALSRTERLIELLEMSRCGPGPFRTGSVH